MEEEPAGKEGQEEIAAKEVQEEIASKAVLDSVLKSDLKPIKVSAPVSKVIKKKS